MNIKSFPLDKIEFPDSYKIKDLYYSDKEFVELYNSAYSLFEIFERIFKRWKRQDSIAISKSVFEYKTKMDQVSLHPEHFYNFRLLDCEIHIVWLKNFYYVEAFNIDSIDSLIIQQKYNFVRSDKSKCWRSRGFTLFSQAQDCFLEFVSDYCSNQIRLLNGDLL